MKRFLRITADAIDELALCASREMCTDMGAVVTFVGTVRDDENGAEISGIDYEAFDEMALHQFNKLFDTLEARGVIASVRLVHRVGFVKAGEPSVWVEVIARHRGEAFEACQWLLTEMKQVVPIWKKPL